MELTITQKRENPLFQRTEVYFTMAHEKSGTPTRSEIRKAVSGAVGGKGVVVLAWARSEYGRTSTRGFAKVYEAKERALELETFPVLVRNGLKEAVKKAEAAPAAPAPPPAKREALKPESPKKEAPKPEAPKKEAPKAEAAKAGGPPAKVEKKEAAPAKKEAPAKEKKPSAKKEGK